MQPTEIIITNMLATGTAFAVRSDDMNESVFVPSKHAVNAGLKPGQKVTAQIVPNVAHGDKTPWIVIAISGAEPLPQPTLADRIREELANGPATTMELAQFLKVNSSDVMQAVREMKLPHTELWALEMTELLQVTE